LGRLARITVALLSALGILIAASGSATAAVRPYREIDLGSTGGPRAASDAVAINDYGSAVGVSQTPDGPHGTLWRADGTKVDLGREPLPVDIDNQGDIALAGSYGVVLHADGSRPTTYGNGLLPYRMNNAGQLILRRPDASSPSGFRYYLGTTNAEYGVFGFPANWVMSDLNDQGQVVGTKIGRNTTYGVVWQQGAGMTRNFGPATGAALINNHGHVVMSERIFCGDPCPGGYDTTHYLAANGTRTVVGGVDDNPRAMNEKDQVVGSEGTLDASYRAWVWSKGARTVLHACDGGCESPIASDINERGTIVGQGSLSLVRSSVPGDPLDVLRALLWTTASR